MTSIRLSMAMLLILVGCQHPPKSGGEFDSGEDMEWNDLMSSYGIPGGVYGKQGLATYIKTINLQDD